MQGFEIKVLKGGLELNSIRQRSHSETSRYHLPSDPTSVQEPIYQRNAETD